MRTIRFFMVLILAAFPLSHAVAQTLWDNGGFVTHVDIRPQGMDESWVQTSLGMTEYGFSHDTYYGTRVADDFTVPEGEMWEIDAITFYALQELGYIGGAKQNPFYGVNLQIWDGPPNDPASAVIYGDTSTDRLNTSTWTEAFRVLESETGQDSTHEIMANRCWTFDRLTPGTYWVDWQTEGESSSPASEAVPVTVLGETGNGNALHFIGGEWLPAVDVGPQGLAFVIEGEVFQIPAPQQLQVRDGDLNETLFSCGETQPPIPEGLDLNPTWSETFLEGPDIQNVVDGYHHQLYNATSCTGTPMVDEIWSIWSPPWDGPTEDGLYYFEIPAAPAGPYCWRVQGWSTPILPQKQTGDFFGDWSSCCCFSVECTTLRTPTISGVGDAACGGSTNETSPFLRWRNVDNNRGYRWEVETASGGIIASGITGPSVNIANIGPLEKGSYVARVQTRGDGAVYCDSEWSESCTFTIGEGPGPEPENPDFTWWPEQPKIGESVRFAELSGEMPLSWFWDFGDGTASDQQNPLHIYNGAGTYTVTRDVELETGHVIDQKTITVAGTVECGNDVCESGETAWSCPADCALESGESGRSPASDKRPVVPAAAGGVQGAKATFWTTEGWLYNPNNETATIVLDFTKRGQSTVFQAGPFVLEPERSLYWANIIEELFETTGSGALWVDSDIPVLFQTRTYNSGDDGTYGQGFAGIQERLTLRSGDGQVYLIGLREDDRFRSNLYFQEIDGFPITVQVDIFGGSGERIGGDTFTVNGHSMRQKNLEIHFGISNVASAFALLSVKDGDGRLAAAASIIDHITGDPTSVQMIHPAQIAAKTEGEVHALVAAVSHTRGAVGSVWKSNLTLTNSSSASQTIQLTYLPEYDRTGAVGDSIDKNISLPAGQQRFWEDVLPELFEIPEEAKTQGSLHIRSPDGVMIDSRTYNERSNSGTLGLGIPALQQGDMIVSGQTGTLIGLKHTGQSRTNVGIAEFSGEASEVELWFLDTEFGVLDLGKVERTVPANSHLQITKIFDQLEGIENTSFHSVRIFVTVKNGGSVYVYATVIDNNSGDATGHLTAKN